MKNEARRGSKRVAGYVLLIYVGLAVLLVLIGLAVFALPYFMRADLAPDEGLSAIGALRTITTAQVIFREDDRDENGVKDYSDLEGLRAADLVGASLGAGIRGGYRFTVVAGGPADAAGEQTWWAAADPMVQDGDPHRHFFTNQTGVIYACEDGPIRPAKGSPNATPDRGRKLGG